MNRLKHRNYSYIYSVVIHLLLLFIFSYMRFTYETEIDDFVTIGFGTMGREGSSGKIEEQIEEQEKIIPVEEKKDDEKVELPETKNRDDDNIVTDSNKEEKTEQPDKIAESSESDGSEGTSDFGFEIDFGGKGKRRIYSSPLPSYPEGVSKEIDIKLRFSIMPDGTVGTIIPLIKADTRLEMAAIYSLRQWRFEPLPRGSKQASQNAIIIFPYRLQ